MSIRQGLFESSSGEADEPITLPKLLFDVVSDLHVDKVNFDPERFLPRNSENLIIAGDVGDYDNFCSIVAFINRACLHYKRVFYVLGNDEFYSKKSVELRECRKHYQHLENIFSNLVVLGAKTNEYFFEEYNLMIFGSTLWSNIPVQYISQKINHPITIEGSQIDTITWNYLFYTQLYKLKLTLERCQEEGIKVLVVTHFSPLPSEVCIDPKYDKSEMNVLYTTNLTSFMDHKVMAGWIFGHTGYNANLTIDGVKVFSNQYRINQGRSFGKFQISYDGNDLKIL